MHPACTNKKQNHLQNSLLRRTQFWVRKSFSKPASLKRASLVLLLYGLDGLLEFFCFPWRCPVLFRLGSLVSLCHVRLVSIVGRCWLVRRCELVSDLSLSNCNFWSAHGALHAHADTQVAVVGSFSFACCHDMFSGNVFRKRNLGNANQWNKPVKHQFFQTSSFVLWFLGCLVYCDAEAV